MIDAVRKSAADDPNALAVGVVLCEISKREGTAAAARAATDPLEFDVAAERLTVALIVEASRELRQAREGFQTIPHNALHDMYANALTNIDHVRRISLGLRGRERFPWEAEAVLNSLELEIQRCLPAQ